MIRQDTGPRTSRTAPLLGTPLGLPWPPVAELDNASETSVITVKSTIIAWNTAALSPDVGGNFTSAGLNLIGKKDGSTGSTQPNDQTGTIALPLHPRLDPSACK